MTLEDAKRNIGGMVRLYFVSKDRTRGCYLYGHILEADDSGITILTEDLRPKEPLWAPFRCVPGDGYTEALELVESPRSATVKRRE